MAFIIILTALTVFVLIGMTVCKAGRACLRIALEVAVGIIGLSLALSVGQWMAALFGVAALAYVIYRTTVKVR